MAYAVPTNKHCPHPRISSPPSKARLSLASSQSLQWWPDAVHATPSRVILIIPVCWDWLWGRGAPWKESWSPLLCYTASQPSSPSWASGASSKHNVKARPDHRFVTVGPEQGGTRSEMFHFPLRFCRELNSVPPQPKSYVQVLTPRTCECDLT